MISELQIVKHNEKLRILNTKVTSSTKPVFWNWQAYLFLPIETSSFIDDLPFWEYYIIQEVATNKLIGFATIFVNYIWADSCRVWISQFIILPDFQKQN